MEQIGKPIAAGSDYFQQPRTMFGTMRLDYKVVSRDTSGGLLVLENTNEHKGGPPRHLHRDQEEWFYVVEGEYIIEIGETRYALKPGDSLLAPRMVPHVWAHTGAGRGRILIGFQPAGKMEAFFAEASRFKSPPPGPELSDLFQQHGMTLLGPPLAV